MNINITIKDGRWMMKNGMSEIIYQSVIRCPFCGYEKEETMPTDACQFFYECTNCKRIIRPKEGDCCVFCSYGSVECPSIQKKRLAEK